MTPGELVQTGNEGKVADEAQVSDVHPAAEAAAPDTVPQSYTLEEFVPILVQLQSLQKTDTAVPTDTPQTFQDQFRFIRIGGIDYLYFYSNNAWKAIQTPVPQIAFTHNTANRGLTVASGTQTIAHGLGKMPSNIRFHCHFSLPSSGSGTCTGTYNGTNQYVAWQSTVPGQTPDAGDTGTVFIFATTPDRATGQSATVAMDATNITLTWTKIGAIVSGQVSFLWEAWA
jgi:hypothetical protein